jgi:hypothetical protein
MSDNPTQATADASDVSQTVGSPSTAVESPNPEPWVKEPVGVPEMDNKTEEKPSEKPVVPVDSLAGVKVEVLPLISGNEPNIERFMELSYTSPVAARMASRSLIETFDDKGQWLASLVQPSHLVAELRQECSELSSLVIMLWVRQGEMQKLKTLSESLLEELPARRTREAARTMAVLAGLLGILRPSIAQKLLTNATPCLNDLADGSLMRDARRWVDAGRVLETSQPEVRNFWNRQLREPGNDWNWDSSESRQALRNLADILPAEGQMLEVFHSAVPGYWWDLWRSQRLMTSGPTSGSSPRKAGVFGLGLLLGMAAAVGIGWFALYSDSSIAPQPAAPKDASSAQASPPTKEAPPVQTAQVAKMAEPAKAPAPPEEEMVPAPPIRESLRQLQSVLRRSASNSPEIGKSANIGSPKASQNLSKPELRNAALARHAEANPEVKRLVSLVKNSSYRENAVLIQGENSVAPRGSPTFRSLIHWLILDPPQHADVRLAVTKLALHALPIEDTVSVFDLCYYPGSANENEIKKCANLLLELPENSITEPHREILNKIIAMNTAKPPQP